MATDTGTTQTVFPSLARRPSQIRRKEDSIRKSLLLERMPPEWNIRVLTDEDFQYYCDIDGVKVRDRQVGQPGLYMTCQGTPTIFIDDALRGAHRLFIWFHELGHHWLHGWGPRFFHSGEDVVEDEADLVAACAMIPLAVIKAHRPNEIMELYNYPEELVRVRQEVFDRWRL